MFGVKNINVPIFGVSISGKTYLLVAICDYLISSGRARVMKGEDYIVPRITAWKRGEKLLKTREKEYHPVTLRIRPSAIAPEINKEVDLTIFDISGDDYAPPTTKAGGVVSIAPPATPAYPGMHPRAVASDPQSQKLQMENIMPSEFFMDKILKADAVITLIDLIQERSSLIAPKPAEAVTLYKQCMLDGSSMTYDEATGNHKCDVNPNHIIRDASLDLMFYFKPLFCDRDRGSKAYFHSGIDRFVCERNITHQWPLLKISPGRLNWSEATIGEAAQQGMRFNNAVRALWQNANYLARWQNSAVQKTFFAMVFSKYDMFRHIPAEKLDYLIDEYFGTAKSYIGKSYRETFMVSATGGIDARFNAPAPWGIERLLQKILIRAA